LRGDLRLRQLGEESARQHCGSFPPRGGAPSR
jgi:hypothetical protein